MIRNVWRRYGGWWDGDPANLKPAPRGRAGHRAGRRWPVARTGWRRAPPSSPTPATCAWPATSSSSPRPAAPDDAGVHAVRADIYERRRQTETSLMTKGIYAAAVRESRAASEPES